MALLFAGFLGHYERNATKVERLASDLIELSTRHHFALWLAGGVTLHGWMRSAWGDTAKGIAWIEDGIQSWRVTGSMLVVPYFLSLKAEALHLANRTPEALEVIKEAEALIERYGERYWCAEVHRLRGVFLAALGADADETQIEAAFCEAIRIAKQQKSISLMKRAEASHTEYRDRKGKRSANAEARRDPTHETEI